MKKRIKFISIILAIILTAALFSSCKINSNNKNLWAQNDGIQVINLIN